MTTLYHYTCDHHAPEIAREGVVLPLSDILGQDAPSLQNLPQSWYGWFTDLDTPHREGLGLTQRISKCDRTAHRFTVTDATEVERWVSVRRYHPEMWHLEEAVGALPMHWWLASEPVPVATP